MEKTPSNTELFMNAYQKRWETRSSVRTRPRKTIDFDESGYFFPEDKQPLFLIKQLKELEQNTKETILILSFYKYLHDIVTLEIKLINSACHKILYSDLPVSYDDTVKLNAYTILIDEYYHVYIAKDMLGQLDTKYPNLHKYDYPISDAFLAISTIKSELDPKYHDMFEIIAVCIFETTLVKELVEFFQSPKVHPSIKHYVNDHMNDESRHYGFFYELLCYTWEKLDEEYKSAIGSAMAKFVTLYLNVESEKKFNNDILKRLLSEDEFSESLTDELYKGFIITQDVPIVKNVLNVLRRAKILDHPSVLAGFNEISMDLSND